MSLLGDTIRKIRLEQGQQSITPRFQDETQVPNESFLQSKIREVRARKAERPVLSPFVPQINPLVEAVRQKLPSLPTKLPEIDLSIEKEPRKIRRQNFKDVANLMVELPAIYAGIIINPVLSMAEASRGRTLGQINIPLFNQQKITFQGVQTDYEERLKAGEDADSAFWNSALSFGLDLTFALSMGKHALKNTLLRKNPEALINRTAFDTQAVRDYISGRSSYLGVKVPQELKTAFGKLSKTKQKEVLFGIRAIDQVSPSNLGKILGITEQQAKELAEQAGLRIISPARQLPGEAIIGKPQPAFGLSIQPRKRVGDAIRKVRAEQKAITPAVAERGLQAPVSLFEVKDSTEALSRLKASLASKVEPSKTAPQRAITPTDPLTLEAKAKTALPTEQKAPIKKPEKTISFSRLTEVANKIKNKSATEKSFDEMRTLLAFADEALLNNPARQLAKYANRSGEIPEVSGTLHKELLKKTEGKFARFGDEIASELGFEDSEQAREAYQQYIKDRKRVDEIKDDVRGLRKDLVDIRKGEKLIRKSITERRIKIRAAQHRYMLTDRELNKIRKGRDIRAMEEDEFNKYIKEIENTGANELERSEALIQVKGTIYEKELGNWETLREVMKLPKLSEMSVSQLREFDEALQPFVAGDVFLSKRILETIDRTELEGVKTWREVRENLAKKLNTTPEKLNNININEFDRLKGQSALSEKDPFFEMVIKETNKLRLIREAEYLEIEKKTFDLAKKIKTTFLQKLIPQQKNISKWFLAEDKSTVKITPEEEELIKYMQAELIKDKDYLIKMEAMQKGIQSDRYYPHIRRGILEAVKEDGIIQAVKEVFNQYKLDEQAFGIVDRETGDILAMDKFFGNALHRTGKLIPTENIVKAFLIYQKTFKKKQALDEITPLIVTYSQALTPKGLTKKGLLLHGDLLRFMKEWLNTQRGRRVTLLAKQGGKIDWALRSSKAFTTMWDLAGNAVVTVASQVGEQAIQYKLLGKVDFVKAKIRAITPRGKRITAKYRNVIGKNPWTEIIEPMKELGDRLNEGIFLLFRDANIRRNRNVLLGSMTKEEWANETLGPERLADLKIYTARYGVVDGMGSIVGATPEAGLAKQYKSWALPILGSEVRNLIYMAKYFKTLGKSEQLRGKRAFIETIRSAELALIVLIVGNLFIDEDDDSFLGKLKQRAYQEAFTLYGALDISSLTDFRVRQFADDIASSIVSIIKLEKYEETKFGEYETGDFKGVRKLEKQFTPRAIKQFQSVPEKIQKDVKQQILKEIEEGKISVETAQERFFNELKKLESANKRKRFKLSEKEYKKDLLERIENKEIGVEDAKEEADEYLDKNKEKIVQNTERSEKGIIDMVMLYAKALETDPFTTFNRIFTGQRIRKIENGAIIVERIPFEESQAIKRERGATKELILDHTIPLQLGGSNSEKNLKLVPVDVWERYTPVENYLGDKLRAGLIGKKEARELIQQFKDGEIVEKDIIK